MSLKFINIFSQVEGFEKQIGKLEDRILELEQRIEHLVNVERNHLIRVKNHEEISDDFIFNGRSYQDLSPEKAWKLYNNKDYPFTMLDVSAKHFRPYQQLPESIHIPFEELKERFLEIQNRTTPLFVISEDGTNSILACEFLVKCGFLNCNNVSGGYKSWKGFQVPDLKNVSG